MIFDELDNFSRVAHGIGHFDVANHDAASVRQVLPADHAATVFVIGRQDFVAWLEVEAAGYVVHAFGCIARQRDFVQLGPNELRSLGSHRFHLIAEAAPSIGQRIALQFGEVRGQGVGRYAGRRPNAAAVEMH